MSSRPTLRAAPRRPYRGDALALAVLCLVTSAHFVASEHLTSAAAWRTPLQFSGDAVFELAGLRSASSAGARCLWNRAEPRLGAPFGADWADFPGTDELRVCAGGLLASAFGAPVAVNVLFALATLLAAVGLYLAARSLGAAPAPAVACGLLYALSPYLFTRNVQHLGLSFFGLVPLGVVAWRRLAQPLRKRHRVTGRLVALSALLGAQTIYYALYFVIGAGMAGVLQALRRNWRAAFVSALCIAAALAVVLALNADTFRLWASEGRNPNAFARSPHDAVVAGLWPEQLFLPSPFHRVPLMREAVAPYARWVGGRGEYPSAYLGLAGAVSLVWLVVEGARRFLRTRSLGPAARSAAVVLAWVAVALPVGLLAGWARLSGMALLRSNDRVSVVLSAVALLWLAVKLTRWTAKRPQWVRAAVAAGVAGLGLLEQVPLTDADVDPDFPAKLAETVAGTRRFVEGLEAQSAEPRRVFVYPPSTFPEDPAPPFKDPYRPLAPFVVSTSASFSAGGVHGRRAGDWPSEVAKQGDDDFARELVAKGFSALITQEAACPEATCGGRLTGVIARLPNARRLDVEGAGWFGWVWDARP